MEDVVRQCVQLLANLEAEGMKPSEEVAPLQLVATAREHWLGVEAEAQASTEPAVTAVYTVVKADAGAACAAPRTTAHLLVLLRAVVAVGRALLEAAGVLPWIIVKCGDADPRTVRVGLGATVADVFAAATAGTLRPTGRCLLFNEGLPLPMDAALDAAGISYGTVLTLESVAGRRAPLERLEARRAKRREAHRRGSLEHEMERRAAAIEDLNDMSNSMSASGGVGFSAFAGRGANFADMFNMDLPTPAAAADADAEVEAESEAEPTAEVEVIAESKAVESPPMPHGLLPLETAGLSDGPNPFSPTGADEGIAMAEEEKEDLRFEAEVRVTAQRVTAQRVHAQEITLVARNLDYDDDGEEENEASDSREDDRKEEPIAVAEGHSEAPQRRRVGVKVKGPDQVLMDTEATYRLWAYWLAGCMPRRSTSGSCLKWAKSTAVLLASVAAAFPFMCILFLLFTLPSFFVILILRPGNVETLVTRLFERTVALRNESTARRRRRYCTLVGRVIPVSALLYVWPSVYAFVVLDDTTMEWKALLCLASTVCAAWGLLGLGTSRAVRSFRLKEARHKQHKQDLLLAPKQKANKDALVTGHSTQDAAARKIQRTFRMYRLSGAEARRNLPLPKDLSAASMLHRDVTYNEFMPHANPVMLARMQHELRDLRAALLSSKGPMRESQDLALRMRPLLSRVEEWLSVAMHIRGYSAKVTYSTARFSRAMWASYTALRTALRTFHDATAKHATGAPGQKASTVSPLVSGAVASLALATMIEAADARRPLRRLRWCSPWTAAVVFALLYDLAAAVSFPFLEVRTENVAMEVSVNATDTSPLLGGTFDFVYGAVDAVEDNHVSQWAAIAASWVLIAACAGVVMSELREYGLYLRAEAAAQEAVAERRRMSEAGVSIHVAPVAPPGPPFDEVRYFYSFTGSLCYAHGEPRVPGWLLMLALVLSDVAFLPITWALLQSVTCSFDGAVPLLLASPTTRCFHGNHRYLVAAAMTTFSIYVPLSCLLAPMLMESSLQARANTGGGLYLSGLFQQVTKSMRIVAVSVWLFWHGSFAANVVPALLLSSSLFMVSVAWMAVHPFHHRRPGEPLAAQPASHVFFSLFISATAGLAMWSVICAILLPSGLDLVSRDDLWLVLLPGAAVTFLWLWIHYNFFSARKWSYDPCGPTCLRFGSALCKSKRRVGIAPSAYVVRG